MSSTPRKVLLPLLLLGVLAAPLLLRQAQRTLHGAAGAAVDELRLGQMRLLPCEIGNHATSSLATIRAYCGTHEVPENWADPAGRHIALKVAIVRSEAANAQRDLVTFIDGGPGGAATQDYPAIAPALEPLRARYHILLVDQRGTGGSNALDCTVLKHRQLANEPGQQVLHECLAEIEQHAAPEYYTTTDAIRDLEDVRRALGGPLLNLVGISYGTRVAQQFAGRYPQSVRSVLLDSPVPNSLVLLSEHARNLENALVALFAQCRAQPPCAQRFDDPYRTLYRVRDALRAHPQTVEIHDPASFSPLRLTLTAESLASVVRFYAYNPLTAALLPLMLQEADRGNYAPLLGQAKLLGDDLGDMISGGMELSVVCAEDEDLLSARDEDRDTLMGNAPISATKAACALWPRGGRPANFHAPLVSALPVLVLSGQFDPVTPPAYGAQIVHELSNARLLIANGQGHVVIGAGCMPKLVDRFVETLQPGTLDAQCLQRLGPTPAFIGYNGAAP